MSYIKKHLPIFSVIFVVIILFSALFYSIYSRIDGFGIFAIMCGIMFFSYAISKSYKISNASDNNEHDNAINNVSQIFKIISNPMFFRLLPPLITLIVSHLEKHKDKLNNQVIQQLQQDMHNIINKFNINDINNNNIAERDANIKRKNNKS